MGTLANLPPHPLSRPCVKGLDVVPKPHGGCHPLVHVRASVKDSITGVDGQIYGDVCVCFLWVRY